MNKILIILLLIVTLTSGCSAPPIKTTEGVLLDVGVNRYGYIGLVNVNGNTLDMPFDKSKIPQDTVNFKDLVGKKVYIYHYDGSDYRSYNSWEIK